MQRRDFLAASCGASASLVPDRIPNSANILASIEEWLDSESIATITTSLMVRLIHCPAAGMSRVRGMSVMRALALW